MTAAAMARFARVRAALPWIAVAALSVAVTLAVQLPAGWITPQFARATHGQLRLVDPSGSLWHGGATLVLAPGSDLDASTLLPGRVEWRTRFWPLVTGRLSMRITQTDAMTGAFWLDATSRGAFVSAGSAVLPASLLAGLGSPFNTLDLQGEVRVDWTDWRWLNGGAYGQLTVTIADVHSRVSRVKPLGSYRAAVVAQGAAATLDLTTLKGPLTLTGHGAFGRDAAETGTDGRGSFVGRASASPDARDALAGLLNLLGRPLGDGSVSLRYGSAMN